MMATIIRPSISFCQKPSTDSADIQVERICTSAVWIEKGHERMIGPVDEVCAAYKAQFD